ncbi:MAG TPA: response regulator [Candidatus Eisenbacteria bacterium]|jgi:two-component system response regulator AtoC|nr:response regulator [Candidatus Eisenbacteria bacterium]
MPGNKILVVDDEPEVRQLMEHFLTERGYDVRIAENGRLALVTLDTFTPDVVLLDMHMPEMDGLETLRRLVVRSPSLPVIMITVNEDIETTARLLQLGAADYVPKPFNLEYLEQAISIQLSATHE